MADDTTTNSIEGPTWTSPKAVRPREEPDPRPKARTTTNSIEGPTWTTSPKAVRPRKEPDFDTSEWPKVPFGFNEGEIYVDREDPVSMGADPAFRSLYMPSAYSSLIEAATFLVDVPILGAGLLLGTGADLLGYTDHSFKNPATLGSSVKRAFETPPIIESALTGEPASVFTRGFDATPREPRSPDERFWASVFYMLGGGLPFPTSLSGIFSSFKRPVSALLKDVPGRGVNRAAAVNALDKAKVAKGPNAAEALVAAARDYANLYARGVGEKPVRTMLTEQALAGIVGVGWGAPEYMADEDGRLEMDLGMGIGTVDVMPTMKILSSIGLPIALAHTPSGLAIAADKTKVMNLLRWVHQQGRVFGGSLIAGIHKEGQKDMASRLFNLLESEQGFLENVFLPAVESGQFSSPGSSTPIRILPDGKVIPAYGGLRPDTLQALKILGLDEPRLAALDAALHGRGNNQRARIVEEDRRAKKLDESFDLLRAKINPGDEAAAAQTVKKAQENLDNEALNALEDALQKARDVYVTLEPTIGAAEASRLSVGLLDAARLASRGVRRKLWDKDLIGTEFVDTSRFGDWAMEQILQAGRARSITPGMGLLYKLAGQKRLKANQIGESGKPLTLDDLEGVLAESGQPLGPNEIPENGLYDIFGSGAWSDRVKVTDLNQFRSEVGDLARRAYLKGDEKAGRRHSSIIDYIDNEILVATNFDDAVWSSGEPARNLRNIEIARLYTKNAKKRFGPKSEIGRVLYLGNKPIPEEFLQRFIKPGAGSGARVELFRDALNEPQKVIQGNNVTWSRDPLATLTLGDNPNVIEAEILRRLTGFLPNGKITQAGVDRFVGQYDSAIDKVPGLRDKLKNLKDLQSSVDEMAAKLTIPDRDSLFKALQDGATLDDVATARRILKENLVDRQLANTASDYIGADVNKAAERFMTKEPHMAEQRANQLEALLAKDVDGHAAAGFRAALWRALRNNSRRFDAHGKVVPGIDTPKLVKLIDDYRPYLEKFYDKNSMEFLDELVKGGPLQQTGTGIKSKSTVRDVMGSNFATIETVGALGRTAGQTFFGYFGINPLVATGMGRRISAYTFGKIGEERIMKFVEDALRDPEKAAALIRRYKELPKWEPSYRTKDVAEGILDDPYGAARGAALTGKDKLRRISEFALRYLKNYSMDKIQRAVRFGLLPAQAESRAVDLETDYQKGPPFIYEDNKIRHEIENAPATTPVAPQDFRASRMPKKGGKIGKPAIELPARPLVSGSTLDRANPLRFAGASPPSGPPNPEIMAGLDQLGMPLFASKGGLASLKKKKKSRQMVY